MTEWEEIGVELAARALEFAGRGKPNPESLPAAEARLTRIVRMIESRPDAEHGLGELAREAKLSRYHFLRIFQQLTGLTPQPVCPPRSPAPCGNATATGAGAGARHCVGFRFCRGQISVVPFARSLASARGHIEEMRATAKRGA